MKQMVTAALLTLLTFSDVTLASQPQAPEWPVYVAYFWRAKPGQAGAYNDYIKGTAEKIDEDARKVGVFEEVVTVTPSQMTVCKASGNYSARHRSPSRDAASGARRRSEVLREVCLGTMRTQAGRQLFARM